MFMIIGVALISLWITSLVAFGKCYIRFNREERAFEKSQRADS